MGFTHLLYVKALLSSNSLNTLAHLCAFVNPYFRLSLPRSKPAKRLRAESTNHDIVGISRLRDMKLNIMSEELVTHTGFEPMLTA